MSHHAVQCFAKLGRHMAFVTACTISLSQIAQVSAGSGNGNGNGNVGNFNGNGNVGNNNGNNNNGNNNGNDNFTDNNGNNVNGNDTGNGVLLDVEAADHTSSFRDRLPQVASPGFRLPAFNCLTDFTSSSWQLPPHALYGLDGASNFVKPVQNELY
jgi:hypothetical protein